MDPNMMMPPPSPSTDGHGDHDHTMMGSMVMSHMTFYWGKNSEILFSGWPGTRTGMYVLALFLVFVLAFGVELLSWYVQRAEKAGGGLAAGLFRTVVHGLRIGLAYLLMLAVMSFNVGVFVVAVVGHSLGFLVFGSRVFKKFSADSDKAAYGNRVFERMLSVNSPSLH
ncbi:Ctr copper transporter family [Perilla frutescens var. hirtella]|nr:Ctr copper transporter family [Perilla frutescens var. hirtella]KAH6810481.1 Ctr copper transporter family [Perilla frutescens var. frutescens]